MNNKEVINGDLSFGPAWARQSAGKCVIHETNAKQGAKGKSGWRKGPDKGKRAIYAHAGRENKGGAGTGRTRDTRINDKTDKRQWQEPAFPKITISFIPEQRGLKPLVRQLSGTRRAYSLFEVAAIFLSRPEFYATSIATTNNGDKAAPLICQCAECKAVFADKRQALAHGLNRHLNMFYDREEKENEPPKGKFLCVARCTLSGELLGPPNYHGFNERLLELHRSRFANLPLDQYRQKIVNETDPAAIEQWKKEASRKTVYRTKLLKEPVVFEHNLHLEQHFAQHYASSLIREGNRFIVPATVSQNLEDGQIKRLIEEAWKKETRFPINMAVAIQKRFRLLGLHIFRTPAKMTFVSAIKPHPIDPTQATDIVRKILEWIKTNSHKTRQNLVTALVPGLAPESKEVADIINALVWLIDRGHVIEFTNGTLTIPNCAGRSTKESKHTSSTTPQSSGNKPQEAPVTGGTT